MSAMSFAFMAKRDLRARQMYAEEKTRGGWPSEKRGRIICNYYGNSPAPCIAPSVLRGMVDRVLLRAQVERDNREEAQPSR